MRCALWVTEQMKSKSEIFSKLEVVSVVKMLHKFASTSSSDVWRDEIATLTQTLVHVGSECWARFWSVRECRACFQCLCIRLIEIRNRQGNLKKLHAIVSENWQCDELRNWFLKEIENVSSSEINKEMADDV